MASTSSREVFAAGAAVCVVLILLSGCSSSSAGSGGDARAADGRASAGDGSPGDSGTSIGKDGAATDARLVADSGAASRDGLAPSVDGASVVDGAASPRDGRVVTDAASPSDTAVAPDTAPTPDASRPDTRLPPDATIGPFSARSVSFPGGTAVGAGPSLVPVLGTVDAMSLSAWVKITGKTNGARYIVKTWDTIWSWPTRQVDFYIKDAATLGFSFACDPAVVLEGKLPAGHNVTAWNHYAAVFDATRQRVAVFANGARVAQVAYKTSKRCVAAASTFRVGNWGSAAQAMEGRIDDVAVWSAGLTDAEVAAVYNKGVPFDLGIARGAYTSFKSLAGYYLMGDGVALTARSIPGRVRKISMQLFFGPKVVADAP